MSETALDAKYEINASTYEWSVRLFSLLRRVLRVNVKLHHDEGQIADGDIFLFNHFARFETFIPQYLIYLETGAYCRSVASSEFFEQGDALSAYLVSVGAVPNDHPRLLPFLASEILRGRKVVVFPEGGMVKDRRVVDERGHYSVYSRMARERRKHHAGAAVLGLALDAFKDAVRQADARGRRGELVAWAERLGLDTVARLVEAARKPTVIVPANITFFPLQVTDNVLRRGAAMLNRSMSRRLSEELLIEGNLLLKHTDMDIRLGDAVRPSDFLHWWERSAMARLTGRAGTLDGFFGLRPDTGRWYERAFALGMAGPVQRVRDAYMQRVYAGVSVNLSHVAASLMIRYVECDETDIDAAVFHRALYLAVKALQPATGVNLHRSLRNPEAYAGVLEGHNRWLDHLVETAERMALVERAEGRYRFLPKLCIEHEFDEVRLENIVVVYANEAEPIAAVGRAVSQAMVAARSMDGQALARRRFDDLLLGHAWDRDYFTKPRYGSVNGQETATVSGAPYLLESARPGARAEVGVLLVHGFLASPAELAGLAHRLHGAGHPVLGVRLKGHGTSPCDLRTRSWHDWLASVREGYDVLSAFAERICVVGFSTGGTLALLHAADAPPGLAGVVGVSVPLRLRNRNLIFVPLVHGANRLLRWLPAYEGVMPFRPNDSEHPHINYRNIPMRGLYELRRVVDAMDGRLRDVRCPVLLLQGDADPVVDPQSVELIHGKLGSANKRMELISTDRHGILNEDIGGAQGRVVAFVSGLAPPPAALAVPLPV